jgi:hypothetical protein
MLGAYLLAARRGALLGAVAFSAAAAPSQIFTENAGVASPELPSLREALSFRKTRNVEDLRLDSQFIWSPSPWLETRTTVPLLLRDFDAGGDSEGLGDASLRLKHLLWKEDDVFESTRLAALYEVSLPTGEDDARAFDGSGARLAPPLQLGAGTFGFGAGGAYTLIRDRHRFSVEGFFRHTLDHDGFSPGDSVRANLAYWYRLSPARFADTTEVHPLEVRGVIELLTSYKFENTSNGAGLGDEGAELWLAPGLQLFGNGRTLFEAALLFPIYQDADDAFGRREWGATLSVKWLF